MFKALVIRNVGFACGFPVFQLGDYAVVVAKYRPKHKGGNRRKGEGEEREGRW